MSRTTSVAAAAALLLLLAGCAPATPGPSAAKTPAADAPATDDAEPRLTDDELDEIFTGIQFIPGQYSDTGEMLDSIYPGLVAADLSCLSPFGAGWEGQPDLVDVPIEFGTSNDRSMTAVVSSTGSSETAAALVDQADQALADCADRSGLFTLQGAPVETSIEKTEATVSGTDDAVAWRVSGTVAGAPFSLVGITAHVGGNAVALVGWDPATNESYVPRATQMFVDAL